MGSVTVPRTIWPTLSYKICMGFVPVPRPVPVPGPVHVQYQFEDQYRFRNCSLFTNQYGVQQHHIQDQLKDQIRFGIKISIGIVLLIISTIGMVFGSSSRSRMQSECVPGFRTISLAGICSGTVPKPVPVSAQLWIQYQDRNGLEI